MPGTAVFLNRGKETAPLAMRANVEHNRVLHRHVIVMSIETVPVPRLTDDERITIDELGYKRDGIIHVSACYGYMERPNIPAALRLLDPAHTEGHIDVDTRFVLPVQARADRGRRTHDGAMAQAAVHRDVLHHLRRRRVFQPATRPDRDHRFPHRGLSLSCPRPYRPCRSSRLCRPSRPYRPYRPSSFVPLPTSIVAQ